MIKAPHAELQATVSRNELHDMLQHCRVVLGVVYRDTMKLFK